MTRLYCDEEPLEEEQAMITAYYKSPIFIPAVPALAGTTEDLVKQHTGAVVVGVVALALGFVAAFAVMRKKGL
jgi:hypothetical protein